MTEAIEQSNQAAPGKGRYIAAFALASALGSLLSWTAVALAFGAAHGLGDAGQAALLAAPALAYAAHCAGWIAIYSRKAFRALRIRSAAPWLAGLHGCLLAAVVVLELSAGTGLSPVGVFLHAVSVAALAAAVYVFAWFFKTRHPERY